MLAKTPMSECREQLAVPDEDEDTAALAADTPLKEQWECGVGKRVEQATCMRLVVGVADAQYLAALNRACRLENARKQIIAQLHRSPIAGLYRNLRGHGDSGDRGGAEHEVLVRDAAKCLLGWHWDDHVAQLASTRQDRQVRLFRNRKDEARAMTGDDGLERRRVRCRLCQRIRDALGRSCVPGRACQRMPNVAADDRDEAGSSERSDYRECSPLLAIENEYALAQLPSCVEETPTEVSAHANGNIGEPQAGMPVCRMRRRRHGSARQSCAVVRDRITWRTA
jgi:hypothetical protein